MTRNNKSPSTKAGEKHISQARIPALRAHAHLLPTLFDRLRDDAPWQLSETPGTSSLSRHQMIAIVQRDLSYLLNTINLEELIGHQRYPAAASSTINFGIPSLAGAYLSTRKWEELERVLHRALIDFEPRIEPASLQIIPLQKDQGSNHYNVLLFEIRGIVRMAHYRLNLLLHSAIDLETNRLSITTPDTTNHMTP
jgi:type VI secretion system protein ImpF